MPTLVEIVDQPAQLARHLPLWSLLLDEALEPNIFYEPWMLEPALRHLRRGEDVRVVLVFEEEPRRLIGVFPVARYARFRRIPIPGGRLWKHPQCFLSTPHLHRARAAEALGAFLDWAASNGLPVFEFSNVVAEGPFHKVLVEVLHERGLESVVTRAMTRPLFRRAESA